jgi:hypothetical protein
LPPRCTPKARWSRPTRTRPLTTVQQYQPMYVDVDRSRQPPWCGCAASSPPASSRTPTPTAPASSC